MSEMGKTHIVIMWTVGPDDVAEGDRIFESHGKWMKGHAREGPTALRSYSISKGPELSNPVDPDSSPTGNTIFVLDEFYESVTLVQTERIDKFPIVMVGCDYWDGLVKWMRQAMEKPKRISRGDIDLFQCVDEVEEVVRLVTKGAVPLPKKI